MIEYLDCADADGAFLHLPMPGSRREQPALDMEILRIVRSRWVELMNAKMKGK